MISLTLKKKIISFAIILLFLIIGCSTIAIWGLQQVNIVKNNAAFVDKIHDNFQELRVLFEQILMGPHDYLIHGNADEKEIFAEDYEELIDIIDRLHALILNQKMKHKPQFEKILSDGENQLLTIAEKLPVFKMQVLDIFNLKLPMESYRAGFYMEEMDLFVRGLESDLKKEGRVLLELSDRAKKQIDIIHTRVLFILIILSITAVFIAIFLSSYLIQSTTGSLGNLVNAARKIISGNLTTRAKVETDDEIGELANSFNNMVKKLVSAQDYLSGIFQGSGDGIRVIDKDFNVVECNMEMENLTAGSSGEYSGGKCYEQFNHESCHTEMCTLKRIMMGEELIKIETIMTTEAGREVPVEFIATPLKKEGEIIGVIESFRDISDRNEAEAALQKSHEKLKQTLRKLKETQTQMLQSEKMASIGQLAAGVAHEINNPTGFISSNLNTLAGYDKDLRSLITQYSNFIAGLKDDMATEKGRALILEKLGRINELEKEIDIDFVLDDTPNLIKECRGGTERIKKIVIDLKDFAHPDEQKLQYADINKNMESTLNVVWNELKYKAKVIKEYGDLPHVKCYSQQLNQVFVNLLVNAAHAIEKQGEIRIMTRALDGKVEIKISDTGKGIPEENLSKIFDPFFTTKEVGKGTGLGLNVAYNIIEKHKGTIDVESTVGKGTTFTIRLPIVE